LEIWSRKRPIRSIPAGARLRVIAGSPFTLVWSSSAHRQQRTATGTATSLAVWFVDISPSSGTTLDLRLIALDGGGELAAGSVEVS
jgi:hypothetical protein